MGKYHRGVRDRSGPYKGSYMYATGHRGRKSGHKRGSC